MSSLFTTTKHLTMKTEFGNDRPVPFYLQFVPGNVIDVVHSRESLRYNGDTSINTIIAKPHITDKVGNRKSLSGEDFRYYPLLRGITDIPSKGDPVLLCTIGKVNYYLGPLNTFNNSPTWNDDPSLKREPILNDSQVGGTTATGLAGESPNFNKEVIFSRLSKYRNDELDYGNAIRETTGDTIIEGRHGNSLRIGSRSDKPYVFISNERNPENYLESLGDGSLISITSNGTLAQHFESYIDGIPVETDEGEDVIIEEGTGEEIFEFKLSSDLIEGNTYPIGDIYMDLNGLNDSYDGIYGYNGNQMLFNSDRITLNSKLDDIFISSTKDIHIGAGRHISIGAFESLNILSSNVNVGNSTRASEMQSMVLGDTLKEVLTDIINLIPSIVITTQLGPQSPMPQIQADIQKITSKIDGILSTYHKIEGN